MELDMNSREAAVINGTSRIHRANGVIYYVATNGDDGNTGISPISPLATIGEALSRVSNGDTVAVAAGVYDETGLDVSSDAINICGQWGTSIVDTSGGTQTLLLSGDGALVQQINIAQAGQIGLKVTGTQCRYESAAITASTVAIDIDGPGTIIDQVFCSGYTVTGIDVSSAANLFRDISINGGNTAVRGIYLSGANADSNTCRYVISAGNQTASFEIVSTAQGNMFTDCASGAGDGPRIDYDTGSNVWARWSFANEIYHTTTFDGSGPSTDNLFRVYGTVEIEWIYGDVETVLSNDIGVVYLETDDGTVQQAVTKLAAGPSASDLVVGSTLLKTADAAVNMTLLDAAQVQFHENTTSKPKASFILQEKTGVATYLRLNYAGVGTSGVIHWHCRFDLLSEDGWLEPA